jgi:hypothetical protein
MRYFIYIVIGIVILAVVAGFFVVGSPKEERARRFDEQRVQHLQFIQGQIGEFYRAKERLPQDLPELNDKFRGITVPQDPETGEEFGYEARGSLTFALCADFNRPTLGQSPEMRQPAMPPFTGHPEMPKPAMTSFEGPFGQETWEHEAGKICFERTIDKDFFIPLEKSRP